MRCRGAKSFVDDLVLSRGVVRSRAVHCCDLLRLSPLTRRFVRLRRTDLLACLPACLPRARAARPVRSFVSACSRGWPVEWTCDFLEVASVYRCWSLAVVVVVVGGVLSVLRMSPEGMPVNARGNHDGVKVAKRRACGLPRPVEWACAYCYLVRVCLDAGRWWLCEACVRARGVLSVLWMSLEAMPVNAGSNHDGVKVTK